jgi:hypothetical protein
VRIFPGAPYPFGDSGCVEDVASAPARGLEKSMLRQLASCSWVTEHLNVLIPAGQASARATSRVLAWLGRRNLLGDGDDTSGAEPARSAIDACLEGSLGIGELAALENTGSLPRRRPCPVQPSPSAVRSARAASTSIPASSSRRTSAMVESAYFAIARAHRSASNG